MLFDADPPYSFNDLFGRVYAYKEKYGMQIYCNLVSMFIHLKSVFSFSEYNKAAPC